MKRCKATRYGRSANSTVKRQVHSSKKSHRQPDGWVFSTAKRGKRDCAPSMPYPNPKHASSTFDNETFACFQSSRNYSQCLSMIVVRTTAPTQNNSNIHPFQNTKYK